jgi:A1 cistron-splicing factor AAR2
MTDQNNYDNSNEATSISHTIACCLDLPSGSAISIDGISVSIQRDDFVGISQIPSQHFHFITVTAKSSALTTGFVLLPGSEVLVRRYDPRTEEVSSTLSVDEMTIQNLKQQLPALEQQQRIVPYSLLVKEVQQAKWSQCLTTYISGDLLQRRGIRTSGQKVIPGCLNDDGGNITGSNHLPSQQEPDGIPLSYFPVPILDQRRPRWASHVGTQQFLQTLSAPERTHLFVDPHPSQRAWERIFAEQYRHNWEWVLGDLQLSFLCFVHLHCFESLMHWRDLLSLLGQLVELPPPAHLLVPVLAHQLSNLDASDVLQTSIDDTEDEEENSIASALKRLVQTCRRQGDNEDMLQRLSSLIEDRLCARIQSVDEDDEEEGRVSEEEGDDYSNAGESDDDSEGPMIVEMDDYEAALQRNQATNPATVSHSVPYAPAIATNYPILWAAKQEHEDLVMTCARALEEANDVSLVRQAADYLEQVEAKSAHL